MHELKLESKHHFWHLQLESVAYETQYKNNSYFLFSHLMFHIFLRTHSHFRSQTMCWRPVRSSVLCLSALCLLLLLSVVLDTSVQKLYGGRSSPAAPAWMSTLFGWWNAEWVDETRTKCTCIHLKSNLNLNWRAVVFASNPSFKFWYTIFLLKLLRVFPVA